MVYYCMILFVLLVKYAKEVECPPAYMISTSANEWTSKIKIHTNLTPEEMRKRKFCWSHEACLYSRMRFDPYEYRMMPQYLAGWCQCKKNETCVYSHFDTRIDHTRYRCQYDGGENSTTDG